MSNFSTAGKVQSTIRASDDVEFRRGQNRVKINNAANCAPPLDAETCQKLGIKVNVNWGELMILLSHARRQYMNAFWSQGTFFKVRLPFAPSDYQSEWESFITETINRPIRKSNAYFELHRSRWAAVSCHGMGPQMWYHSDPWKPKFIALEDLRIPTDTTLDFENLDWFSARRTYTPYELIEEVFPSTPRPNNKWDKVAVAHILQNYKQINVEYAPSHYDWLTTPEKLAELVRQDGGYWSSSAVPGISLQHFYFRDDSDRANKGWFMRIVPEFGTTRGVDTEKFLWTDTRPVARKREHLMHCQFGDLSNKAPFLVDSVRSLGFALLEPTFYTNLTRNRLVQHLHDNFNVWLRLTDPTDKARAQVQEFGNYSIVKQGVGVVPQTERHQVQGDLVEMTMGQLKQLQGEASSSYTQDTDNGTKREQTAYETSVKMQQVNALSSGLLMTAFKYATTEYEEIARRFCIKNSDDEDVQRFQKLCKQAGIPLKYMNPEQWDIEPVTPLGFGNPAMAMTQAQQLMSINGALDATAQQEVKHEFVLAVTGDARKAARWVPLGKGRGVTDAQRDAQMVFGTLMQGVPVPSREGLSEMDQIEAMLPLMAGKISMIEQRDNTGNPDEVQGLQTVGDYIAPLIEKLAQDPQQKTRVKQYGDALGKLMNIVKGLAQRGQQKAQQAQQQQNDGMAQAKLHESMMQAAANLHAKQVADQQALHQKEQEAALEAQLRSKEFVHDQRREDARTMADIERQKELNKIKDEAPAPKPAAA